MAGKHGSIKAAAESMFVTPPAVTMQIKNLEGVLGTQLFKKKDGRLQLTEEAMEVFVYAEKIFTVVEELELYVDQKAKSEKGRLILGTHHMLARFIVPPLLKWFKEEFEDTEVKVILGSIPQLIDRLLGHELHCILLASNPYPDKIKTIPLFQEELILVAAENSKFIDRRRISVQEIASLPLLMVQHDTNIYRMITSYMEANGVTPNIAMDNLSGDVIHGFLLQDAGVAFSIRFIVQDSIEKGFLQEIEIEGGLPKAELCLAFLRENLEKSPLRSLISWLETTHFERSQFIL